MTPLCNDQLTRVRQARVYKFTQLERTFRVGDKGDKNGMPYTIKAFAVNIGGYASARRLRDGEKDSPSVWMLVKYRGDKRHKWDSLLIGDTSSFQEPIILGGLHKNPAFTHYWPKDWAQPFLPPPKLLPPHEP